VDSLNDFPALYASTDLLSRKAQTVFLRVLRVRLFGLLVATAGGAVTVSFVGFSVGGAVAFLGFAIALICELYSATNRPDRVWYEGRAAAESIKTLAWRFAIKGESFEEADEGAAEGKFLSELNGILQDLDALTLPSEPGQTVQITEAMRRARKSPFEARRDLYRNERILDQQKWYSAKAAWNERRASRWTVATFVIEGAGLLVGASAAFGLIKFDLLGILAATAATITAWVQAKQFSNLATAYGVTTQELGSVLSELEALRNEADWPKFVGGAEEAISREHTLWRASRGIRIRKPRTLT